MKLRPLTLVLTTIAVLTLCNAANALPLSGEYTVGVTTQQIDSDNWNFTYSVYNANQGGGQAYRGLDGFSVDIPDGTVLNDITVPAPYYGWGSWTYGTSGNTVFWTWGLEEGSVYPQGSTAVFSFVADDVAVGSVDAELATYNGPNSYVYFQTQVTGPVATTPDGGVTLLLLGSALAAIGVIRRRV